MTDARVRKIHARITISRRKKLTIQKKQAKSRFIAVNLP